MDSTCLPGNWGWNGTRWRGLGPLYGVYWHSENGTIQEMVRKRWQVFWA